MWDLVPWPGDPGPLHGGAWRLSHWTTREIPPNFLLFIYWSCCAAWRSYFPNQKLNPLPLAVRAQSPNHWCMLSPFSPVQLFLSLWTEPARLLCPWDSPGKNTGVGYHALLQGIFWTQGSNLHLLWLLRCRQIVYCWASREAHKNLTIFLVKSDKEVVRFLIWVVTTWMWSLIKLWVFVCMMYFS